MVSFFGEVVFPSSRAFWDEEDENGSTESTINQSELSVRWLKEKPTSIETLIVIDGEMLIDFSKECLSQDSEIVCHVEDENVKKVSVIYQINQEVYLCIISPRFDVKLSAKFVETVSDILLSAKRTISITCSHVSQFKSSDVPSTPSFLRMLSTKRGEDCCKLNTTLLERPNIVFGVAAGVLSYAEFMELPSVLYILYTDGFTLDSTSAEPLLTLFAALNCIPHDVKYTGRNFFNKGNLYM